MTSKRHRHPPLSGFTESNVEVSVEKEGLLGFSDDDEDVSSATPVKFGETTTKADISIPPEYGSDVLSESSIPSQFSREPDEVEGDIDIFNKAVHITNLDKVDHGKLLRKMHERFKKKVNKWEALAYSYSRYNFAMNFAILVLQLAQMVLQQASNVWSAADRELVENKRQSKTFLHHIGIYRMSEWRNTSKFYGNDFLGGMLGALHTLFSPHVLQTVHSLLTAATALIAGLQLKLKLSQKSERYRRGAKVYGRLLRISTYYIMLVESGGKIDDVTGLWREAMKKEGKWIPLVRTYMPM